MCSVIFRYQAGRIKGEIRSYIDSSDAQFCVRLVIVQGNFTLAIHSNSSLRYKFCKLCAILINISSLNTIVN
jgi:hypothetical protein